MATYSPAITLHDVDNLKSLLPLPIVATGMVKNDALFEHSEHIIFWDNLALANSTTDRNGVISGTVKVLGALQNKARVSLYYRKTGQLVQSTFTNANGVFEFRCGLNRNVSDYYAVAITDQPFNAQVFDKLTPV
jgi:hypothetical protein